MITGLTLARARNARAFCFFFGSSLFAHVRERAAGDDRFVACIMSRASAASTFRTPGWPRVECPRAARRTVLYCSATVISAQKSARRLHNQCLYRVPIVFSLLFTSQPCGFAVHPLAGALSQMSCTVLYSRKAQPARALSISRRALAGREAGALVEGRRHSGVLTKRTQATSDKTN